MKTSLQKACRPMASRDFKVATSWYCTDVQLHHAIDEPLDTIMAQVEVTSDHSFMPWKYATHVGIG